MFAYRTEWRHNAALQLYISSTLSTRTVNAPLSLGDSEGVFGALLKFSETFSEFYAMDQHRVFMGR